MQPRESTKSTYCPLCGGWAIWMVWVQRWRCRCGLNATNAEFQRMESEARRVLHQLADAKAEHAERHLRETKP